MKIKNISFSYESRQNNDLKIKNINKMEIIFKEGMEKPIVCVDTDEVKFEDQSFELNVDIILNKVGKLEYDKTEKINYPREFCQFFWKLVINDDVYEGDFEIPFFVSEIKKIIKCDVIFDSVKKKIANYLK